MFKLAVLWLSFAAVALAQNPQTQTAPLFAANAKYTNGVAPGYAPTAGAGLVLNVGPGTANCSGTMITYSGGTLSMTASVTNYVYLNTASSCAVASKTSTFTSTDIPIAIVVASGSAITGITDDRTPFMVPGAGAGMVYPSAGIARSTGSAWTTPVAFADITALWAGGSCSGFLKNDGGCSTNAPTASALLASPTTCLSTQAAVGILANGDATGCFTPSTGISGMTPGEVAIANLSTTIGSSKPMAGTGPGLVTGPVSGTTAGHLVVYADANGTTQDGGAATTGIANINGNTASTQTIESTDSSIVVSTPDGSHINLVGTGLQYNPPTTAILITGSSVNVDDAHVTSSPITAAAWSCAAGLCTFNSAAPHGLSTGGYADVKGVTSWPAAPSGLNPYDTGYGTGPITVTSATQFTMAYLGGGTPSGTGGSIYSANFYGVYAAALKPNLLGHGTMNYRFGALSDLVTNATTNFGSITGSPKIVIINGGQNDVLGSTNPIITAAAVESSMQALWTYFHAHGWFVYQMPISPTSWGFATCNSSSGGSTDYCTASIQFVNAWLPTQAKQSAAVGSGAYYDAIIDLSTYQESTGGGNSLMGVAAGGGDAFADRINNAFATHSGSLTGISPWWVLEANNRVLFLSGHTHSGLDIASLGGTIELSSGDGGTVARTLNISSLSGGGTQFLDIDNGGNVGTGIPPTGLSGGTSGQVPIMNSTTTANTSKAVAGTGPGLVTGPVSGTTAGHLVTEVGADGTNQDSGVSLTAIPAADIAVGALASGMTGTTQAPGTNNTTLATMAAVQAAIAAAGTGAGIVTYSGPSLTFTGTLYFPIGGGGLSSTTETNVDIDSPAAVTIQNMTVQMSAAPGVGNTIVYTWRKNAADTALTCTISGASATSCSDTTHNFSTASLDLLDIKVVTTGTVIGTPTVVMAAQVGIAASGTTAFSSLSGGTNTTAAMVVGSGASLAVSGSGTIGATSLSALSGLPAQAANTVDMNATGGSAVPTAVAMPTCTTGADLYNTSTHTWSCVSTGGGSGFSPFPATQTTPLAANFTTTNFSGQTVADKTGRMVATIVGSTTTMPGLISTTVLPATPYTIDIAGTYSSPIQSSSAFVALTLRNSSSGKLVAFEMRLTQSTLIPQFVGEQWTNFTTFSATDFTVASVPVNMGYFALRITDDGTNRKFLYSNNGQDYFQLASEVDTTFMTADTAAISFLNGTGGGQSINFSIYNYAVTGSVLPNVGP